MLKKIIILSCCILSNNVFAGIVTGLSVGPAWIFGNRTQTIFLEPDVVKTYKAENETHTLVDGEFFLGWQMPVCATSWTQPMFAQFGVAVAGAANARLEGDIWEDADPKFDNYDYRYKVENLRVTLKGRLIGDCNRGLEPYLSAGAGVAFNRAYDFTIHPKISQEVPAPAFEAKTTTSFTYNVGLGFQTSVAPHLQAAIGYEFADWGKTQLARAPGQTVNQGIRLHHLYANQLLFSMFYSA